MKATHFLQLRVVSVLIIASVLVNFAAQVIHLQTNLDRDHRQHRRDRFIVVDNTTNTDAPVNATIRTLINVTAPLSSSSSPPAATNLTSTVAPLLSASPPPIPPPPTNTDAPVNATIRTLINVTAPLSSLSSSSSSPPAATNLTSTVGPLLAASPPPIPPPPTSFTLRNRTAIQIPKEVTHIFSNRRRDRVGAALLDYFSAHAFAHLVSRQYGGACGKDYFTEPWKSWNLKGLGLLETMGLTQAFPIKSSCPFDSNGKSVDDPSAMLVGQDVYFQATKNFRLQLFSDSWVDKMTSYSNFLNPQKTMKDDIAKNHTSKTIVAHIRRGDVQPCDVYTQDRYLPNSYYLGLIRQYQTADHRVIVHSESKSWEDWSDFDGVERLELKLNSPTDKVWRDIIDADVFIMSKSSYSQLPAIFNRGEVICYPWPYCHGRWLAADDARIKKAREDLQKLTVDRCEHMMDSRKLNWTTRVQYMGE